MHSKNSQKWKEATAIVIESVELDRAKINQYYIESSLKPNCFHQKLSQSIHLKVLKTSKKFLNSKSIFLGTKTIEKLREVSNVIRKYPIWLKTEFKNTNKHHKYELIKRIKKLIELKQWWSIICSFW
jgi:hypothetical protein